MQVRKDSIRVSILQESRKEFARAGYAGAAMKVIASNCGISVGTIYTYFGNKKKLFAAVVEPAKAAIAELCDCRDAESFYSLVRGLRVELRILLFKGETERKIDCTRCSEASELCRKMSSAWLYGLLEVLLMHKPTKPEAIQMINEYLNALQAAKNTEK